jgi:hypothetical protein
MSPPRRPRGEKPATTIRFLQRQLLTATATIGQQRATIADKEKVIAGYDAQLSEAHDTEEKLRRCIADQAGHCGDLSARLRLKSERLAFLEGYYAKSQEAAPATRSVSVASPSFLSDQPETHAAERARDQENLSARRQRGQEAGIDQGAAGPGSRLGDPVWRQHSCYTPHPQGRPVEHIEVTEHGLSRAKSRGRDWSA